MTRSRKDGSLRRMPAKKNLKKVPPSPAPEPARVLLQTRVPKPLYQSVVDMAKRDNRSIQSFLMAWLPDWLKVTQAELDKRERGAA